MVNISRIISAHYLVYYISLNLNLNLKIKKPTDTIKSKLCREKLTVVYVGNHGKNGSPWSFNQNKAILRVIL